MWAGTEGPVATLEASVDRVGRQTPFSVSLRAGRSGLAHWTVEARDAAGNTAVLSQREIPREGVLGSDVRTRTLDLTLDAAAEGLREGPAQILVYAGDHSPGALLHDGTPRRNELTVGFRWDFGHR